MVIEDAIRQEVRKKALSAKGYEDMMLTFAQAQMEWEDYQEQEEILKNYRDERNRGIQTTARAVDEQVQRDDTGGVQQGGGGSGALLQGASPVSHQAGNGRAGEQSAGAGGSVADTDGASQGVRAEQEAEVSRLATDAVLLALRDAGIDVSVASDAQAEAVLGRITAGAELSRKQKRALDTAEQSRKTTIATAVSSADGAKVLKNIDTAISEYENKGNTTKTFIGDIANALGINQPERSSKYATFETAGGKVVTIRISNHNVKVSNFDNAGEEYGISIVITRKPNSKVINDGDAHIAEFFYPEILLNRADGKPLVEILKGIKQALYSGEYKDTTGLAEYQEVNAGGAELMRTPQGVVYGWTEGGKIYLTEAGLQPETPIHEYTHIWANAMMQGNPEGWQSIKNLLKDTPLWDEVADDANYQHLSGNEDAIASEALSRFSGREGRAKLEAMVRQMTDGATEKTQAGSVVAKMREALSGFWKWVGEALFNIKGFDSVEEVADRVLYDLMNGTELGAKVHHSRAEMQIKGDGYTEEMERIVSEAKANGTYMLAPNGKPTNLNERQWVQVRTQAFKEWFGDWEKSARIEKLKGSTPIVNEYNGEYELNRESAKAWAKENVRGAYTNKDTGDRIDVSRVGIDKVTSHGERDDAHLKSLVSVPEIVEGSIFIDEMPNEKGNGKYDSYRYYISGIKIDGEDYTVKMVVGVKGDNKYYDHELTQIEKGQLIDSLNLIAKQVAEKQSTLSDVKDTKLVSLLQTNSSKVVDENGEPLVVYHGTNVDAQFTMFDTYGSRYGLMGQGAYFTDDKSVATSYTKKEKGNSPRVYEVFLNIRNPLDMDAQGSREVWEGMFGDVDFSGVEGTNETFLRVVEDYLTDSEYPAYEAHEIVQYGYMDGGFDGMVHVGGGRTKADGVKHNVKIAFEPNQIKSATDNIGTFDASNDDIRYQRGSGEQAGVPVRSATREAVERVVERMQATGLNDVVVMEQAEFDRKLAEIRGKAYTARRQAEVNKRFNEDLNRQKAGTLPKRHVYQLGMPSEALLSGGLPNLPIELSAERLAGKASQTNHPFDLGNVVNLPTALANPIAVFDSKTQPHSKVILTELTDERGKNFVVALQVRISDGNRKSSIEVNSIRSIYPKDSKVAVSGWMNDGLLRWVDKGKAINYLSTQEPNYLAGGSEANSLSDATKIVESFENPIANQDEVSFAFENLTEERARELGYKSFRGQYLRSGTDTPNAKMRAEFGDMSVEEAREKFVSDFVERIFGSQKRDEKIRAFEDYLLRQGIEPVQSGKSESRYYYYNGTKYRFSGHVHPSGSMTNSTFNVVDFAADPHLIDGVEFMRSPQGVVYGFVTGDGVIYLNPSVLNLNTPIHEFGHLWNSFVRRSNPALWKQGADAVRNSVYWERVNSNPAYSGLSDEGKLDEALAMAIGDRGEALLSNGAGFNSIVLRGWLTRLWLWLKGALGFGASVREFSDVALGDLLGGKALVNKGTKGVQGSIDAQVRKAEQETDVHPSENQKKSGNYRKGRVRINGLNVSIEQPKGSVRSGVDENGKSWSITMKHTYGYIGGTKGKDGDHIDVFLSDNLDGWNGTVYVIDQVNDKGGFDEHKVMYGFNSQEEARKAYLSNYEDGWQGLGGITPVSKEVFKGWLQSSGRKTKAFAQYKGVKGDAGADYQRVNDLFNTELHQFRNGKLPVGHIFRLGMPNAILRSVGLPNLPIEMNSARLKTKSMQENHLFDIVEVENLPNAIQNPIAVFSYGDRNKAVNIITELQDKQGKKYLVGVHFNQERNGLQINSVRGIFPKDNAEWLNWITQNKALYLNKEKVQDLITQQQTNLADVSYLDLNSATKIVENFENPPISEENDVRYRRVEAEMSETERIVSEAKANGTYMQAPNGKPTNLNERQWVQVRTQAFKEWFGDWEKSARIEKLRKAEPVVLTGNEYEGKYELNRDSAKQWLKASLRGTYTIADTNEQVEISKVGIGKVTSHSMGNEAHLKSLVAIPQLIEHAIFVEEVENVKGNDKYDSYRYYVLGLQIDGVDYTVKLTIGVKQGKKYYDHTLTQIEKGRLIDLENQPARSFTTAGDAPSQPNALSDIKDKRLLSILQTDASKVVDENGEPLVVYHGTNANFNTFTPSIRGKMGKGIYFTPSKKTAKKYAQKINGERVIPAFIDIKQPLYLDNPLSSKNVKEGDGIVAGQKYGKEETEMLVFHPNQIKSATDNVGTFDGANNDIRFQAGSDALPDADAMRDELDRRLGGKATQDENGVVERKKWNRSVWIEHHVDRLFPLKVLQDLVAEANGIEVSDFDNAYMQGTHVAGKIDAEYQEFSKRLFEPMLDAMAEVKFCFM